MASQERELVKNPKTGRAILVGGKAWKALVAEGVLVGAGEEEKRPRQRRTVKAAEVVKRASRVAARELVTNPEAYREVMQAADDEYHGDVGRRAAASAEAESELSSRLEAMLLEDLCRSDSPPPPPRRPAAGPVLHKKQPARRGRVLAPAPVWELDEGEAQEGERPDNLEAWSESEPDDGSELDS